MTDQEAADALWLRIQNIHYKDGGEPVYELLAAALAEAFEAGAKHARDQDDRIRSATVRGYLRRQWANFEIMRANRIDRP